MNFYLFLSHYNLIIISKMVVGMYTHKEDVYITHTHTHNKCIEYLVKESTRQAKPENIVCSQCSYSQVSLD